MQTNWIFASLTNADAAVHVRLTRLGWHFAFVGTFATLGGAIRGFNLPLVLAGLIVGALLMQWRLGRRSIESIAVRRRLPDEAFARQAFSIQFLAANCSRFWPVFLIRIDDRIEVPRGGPAIVGQRMPNQLASYFRRDTVLVSASCGLGRIAAKRTAVASYECLATRRGRYEFGPGALSTGMPLGLMTAKRAISERQTLLVFPQIFPLRRDWRRQLQSRSGGTATTARRSGPSEGDFFGLRSWQAGDSRRWIHWRTTARIGEPAVRQFEHQKRFELCVMVDAYLPPAASAAASSTAAAEEAVEATISAAASLITQIVPTPTNRIALAVAGTTSAVVSSGGNREQLAAMLRLLAEAAPAAQPDLFAAVDRVFRSIGRPEDLVVVSPRVMPPEADQIRRILSRRCTLRWYSTADGTMDLLVVRPTPASPDARTLGRADRLSEQPAMPISPQAQNAAD